MDRRHILKPDESDKLYRAAKILALAIYVLESDKNALTWLKTPNNALKGEIPLNLLDTEVGAHLVEDLLYRIEYGVYS